MILFYNKTNVNNKFQVNYDKKEAIKIFEEKNTLPYEWNLGTSYTRLISNFPIEEVF